MVRRAKRTRFLNIYVTETIKFGSFSVLVWGAIKGDGTRFVMECPPTINSEKYIDILVNGLFPLYDPQDIFMQDGASCHTSRVTMDFHNISNIMLLSDWPPQSPDINIIENL